MLELLDNGSDSLSLSQPGAFTFARKLAAGSPYAVSVAVHPPARYCSVANGGGRADSDVTDVEVGCTAGTFKLLYAFGTSTTAPLSPSAALTLGADGDFYGTSIAGGANGDGTLFKMTATGQLSVLYSFGSGSDDGSNPVGRPVFGTNGMLYGLTSSGGTHRSGTLYELDPATGHESVLVSLLPSTQGAAPQGSLLLAGNGKFYATTNVGGSGAEGTCTELRSPAANTATEPFSRSTEPPVRHGDALPYEVVDHVQDPSAAAAPAQQEAQPTRSADHGLPALHRAERLWGRR